MINRRSARSVSNDYNNTPTSSVTTMLNTPSIQGIQLVDQVKSLGVILHEGLSFDLPVHVTSLLKQCSQRIYLLRLLRSQGMSSNHLA